MCFDRGALRYAARYGDRYVVDLQGSFAEYITKFSKKSRGNLQRAAKKFEKETDSVAAVLEFRSPSEIIAFRDIAVAISDASYKSDLGWGFPKDKVSLARLNSMPLPAVCAVTCSYRAVSPRPTSSVESIVILSSIST